MPTLERTETLSPHIDRIRELNEECRGNWVRVHEELGAEGIVVPYSTLTGFCRRHGIGVTVKPPKGRYEFAPGQEAQHDTSPHPVVVGGRKQLVQCASCVLCFSRTIYAQCYPTFNRFYCKVFLTEAFVHFGGAAEATMVDNTSVVVARGTGKNAVIAPEMEAFAQRFGTRFIAHEVGDANRSARVEGPFFYIERNFYPGRRFADLSDLNRQLRQWCEQKNQRFIRTIQARPIDLYQTERLHLQRLPVYIPESYAVHQRIVDLYGYVNLSTNAYSVPPHCISRKVEVRETKDRVLIFDGPRKIAEHERKAEGARQRVTSPEHCPEGRRRPRSSRRTLIPEETVLRSAAPQLDALIDLISKRHGRSVRRIRRLYRLYLEYPTDALTQAIAGALPYGLTDLERLERMVLRNIAGDFFQLPALTPDTRLENETGEATDDGSNHEEG